MLYFGELHTPKSKISQLVTQFMCLKITKRKLKIKIICTTKEVTENNYNIKATCKVMDTSTLPPPMKMINN